MNQSDIDWWEVLERGSEIVTIASTVGAIASKRKESAGLAIASGIARLFCLVAAPPRCPSCNKHMSRTPSALECKFCGFVQIISDLALEE